MNNILFNIAIIIFFIGVILATIYSTRIYYKNYCANKVFLYDENNKKSTVKEQYDFRPSNEFSKMFNQPSIWMGYQDLDTIKSSKYAYDQIVKDTLKNI